MIESYCIKKYVSNDVNPFYSKENSMYFISGKI